MPVVWCILNGSRAQGLLYGSKEWSQPISIELACASEIVKNGVPPNFPTAYVPLQHSPPFKTVTSL